MTYRGFSFDSCISTFIVNVGTSGYTFKDFESQWSGPPGLYFTKPPKAHKPVTSNPFVKF